jgi:preprotein translocase subunit SecE
MATKTAIANNDDGPFKRPKFLDGIVGSWTNFASFLSDVRAEMRKVVSPSWIEVRTTTFVVMITVVLFGVFFFLVDWIFRVGVNNLLNKLGGSQ